MVETIADPHVADHVVEPLTTEPPVTGPGVGESPDPIRRDDARFTASVFGGYSPESTAVSYDESRVPSGAMIGVMSVPRVDGRVSVLIGVRGLLPGHAYVAHAHLRPCGVSPADAGPRHRDGIRLALDTDAHGSAVAAVTVEPPSGEPPRSVVIRADADHPLACANHEF